MSPRFRLEVFEGPLDLLLHLIKKHELDLYDIPISMITDQYLETIQLVRELNLDLAGEYLVMAATLIQIKARMLLPPEEADEEDEDPRSELVHQLEEYIRYKEAARHLADRDLLDRDVFRRSPEEELHGPGELPPLKPHAVGELLEAFREILRRLPEDAPREVAGERVSLADRIRHLVHRLREEGPVEFQNLFGPEPTRNELVVTFLALLELIRRQFVVAEQPERFGPIWIRSTGVFSEESLAIEDEYGD